MQGVCVGGTALPAHEVQAGLGVEQPPEQDKGLDHVLVRLVGQHLAHEQPVVPSLGAPLGEPFHEALIRRAEKVGGVDHERGHGAAAIAGLLELDTVELGVRESELDDRGELGQLPAAEPDLLTEVGQPPLHELGRADVVVVEQLQTRVGREHIGRGGADGGLVTDPLTLGRLAGKLLEQVHTAVEARSHVARVDLRDESHRVQDPLGFQGVVADGVALDDGGDDLVYPDRSLPHSPPPVPLSRPGPGRRAETAKSSGSCAAGSLASGSNTARSPSP